MRVARFKAVCVRLVDSHGYILDTHKYSTTLVNTCHAVLVMTVLHQRPNELSESHHRPCAMETAELNALVEWLGFTTCTYVHPTTAHPLHGTPSYATDYPSHASTLASLASAGCGWRSWRGPTRRPRLLLPGQQSSGSQKHGSRSLSSSFVTSGASGS